MTRCDRSHRVAHLSLHLPGRGDSGLRPAPRHGKVQKNWLQCWEWGSENQRKDIQILGLMFYGDFPHSIPNLQYCLLDIIFLLEGYCQYWHYLLEISAQIMSVKCPYNYYKIQETITKILFKSLLYILSQTKYIIKNLKMTVGQLLPYFWSIISLLTHNYSVH